MRPTTNQRGLGLGLGLGCMSYIRMRKCFNIAYFTKLYDYVSIYINLCFFLFLIFYKYFHSLTMLSTSTRLLIYSTFVHQYFLQLSADPMDSGHIGPSPKYGYRHPKIIRTAMYIGVNLLCGNIDLNMRAFIQHTTKIVCGKGITLHDGHGSSTEGAKFNTVTLRYIYLE